MLSGDRPPPDTHCHCLLFDSATQWEFSPWVLYVLFPAGWSCHYPVIQPVNCRCCSRPCRHGYGGMSQSHHHPSGQLNSKSNIFLPVVLHSSFWSPHHFPVGSQRSAPDLGRHRRRGRCADPASQPRSRVVHRWPAARLVFCVRLYHWTRCVRLHYGNPVLDSAQQVGVRFSLDLCRSWHRRQCHYALPAEQDGVELGRADWILLGRHHIAESSLCVFLHPGDKGQDDARDGYFV